MARISINRRQLNAFGLQFPLGDDTSVVVFQEIGSVRVSFNEPPAAAGCLVLSAAMTVGSVRALTQLLPAGDDAEVYVPCIENMMSI